jgi:hypothetical protein
VIKAAKKEDEEHEEAAEEEEEDQDPSKQAVLNLVPCQFCEKMFAQALIEKHLENCAKNKAKEKKKVGGAAKKK